MARGRYTFIALVGLMAALPGADVHAAPVTAAAAVNVHVNVDARSTGKPFPHFWEEMFGSGRAVLALRDDYRADLSQVKRATGFTYVRAHGILDDDIGVFRLDKGKPVYNFSYVDQIYDGLLARGVKPYVELSFMPADLDSQPKAARPLFYRLIASPPKSYVLWDGLIKAFAQHLVQRYGIDEVASWYFEVWNEPNIAFWNGTPAQASYFKLYDHTARDLKAVSPRLRVGGPSTASNAWVPEFLAHAHEKHVPVDFVSTHAYGDPCGAVATVHRQIEASPYPHLPFILSEFNATIYTVPNMLDSPFMGPYIAQVIQGCAGKVDMMSYWSFSDVFEEQGVVQTPFYGGYGLIAEDRIAKPVFNAFAMLHQLGRTRLPAGNGPVLATRRDDGSIVLAMWNYAEPVSTKTTYVDARPKGSSKRFTVEVSRLGAVDSATVWRLDYDHGNVIRAFDAMGRPAYPSHAQVLALRQAARPAAPERIAVRDGRFSLDVPPQGLVVVQLGPGTERQQ